MREPSEYEPAVVVVLDQLPELKVVHDAIEDGTIRRYFPTPSAPGEYRRNPGMRFSVEAREEQLIAASDGPALLPETWKPGAEFRVLEDDVEFVMAAAFKTLQKRTWGGFLKNMLTGRDKAASNIISFLAPVVIEKTPRTAE